MKEILIVDDEEKIRMGKSIIRGSLFSYAFILLLDSIFFKSYLYTFLAFSVVVKDIALKLYSLSFSTSSIPAIASPRSFPSLSYKLNLILTIRNQVFTIKVLD